MIRTAAMAILFATSLIAHASEEAKIKADPAKGKVIAETVCVACHGADGNSAAPNFPKLAGQGERYLLKQLHDIKGGKRTVLEMTGILDNLSDQDMADIAAYFAGQKMSVGAADPKLIERGEALFRGGKLAEGMPACTGCHSPNGAGLAAAGFPKLGGQHGQYVAKQLTDFREGNRTNDGDAMTMRAIAAKLSNKDIEAVSSYIQGLH